VARQLMLMQHHAAAARIGALTVQGPQLWQLLGCGLAGRAAARLHTRALLLVLLPRLRPRQAGLLVRTVGPADARAAAAAAAAGVRAACMAAGAPCCGWRVG